MREIILDTETTGLSAADHRVIEIGAIELVSRLPTGRTFHVYINPQQEIDAGATRIHGITNDQLADKPLFADIAQDFLDFMAEDPLVAHNASFDVGFLNMEMQRLDRPSLTNEIIDTLAMARKQLPGARHSLDALCRRYNVDLSARTYHGALLDAQLLADVYVELTGGLQGNLILDSLAKTTKEAAAASANKPSHPVKVLPATEDELAIHQAFIDKIRGNIWD